MNILLHIYIYVMVYIYIYAAAVGPRGGGAGRSNVIDDKLSKSEDKSKMR